MKKRTSDTLGLFAFLSLLIFSLSFILNKFNLDTFLITYIGYGIVLILILIMAKFYVDNLSLSWKVIFYIIAILSIFDYFFFRHILFS